MALVRCQECKKEINTTADKCPHCGHKEVDLTSYVFVNLAILVSFTIITIIIVFLDS